MNQPYTTKTCRFCGSKIPKIASKCKECGTYLNWRRTLPYMAVFVSIFLGIISVFSTFYPLAKEFTTPEFEVGVEKVGINSKYYTLVVNNSGKEPVVIKYISVFYGEEVGFLEIEGDDHIVSENSTRLLNLFLPEDFIRPSMEEVDFNRKEFDGTQYNRCGIIISVYGSGKEELLEIFEDHCWEFMDFITGIQSVG